MTYLLRRRWLAAGIALAVVALLIALPLLWLAGGSDQAPPVDEAAVVNEASTIVEEATPVVNPAVAAPPVAPKGVAVARLVIPRVGIDARTVTLGLDAKGGMLAPSTPVDVAWYNFSAKPGAGGNIVMSGHVDYANYGPAVFWRLRELRPGDVVQVLLVDQSVVSYQVSSVSQYDSQTAPIQEIVGKTPVETITLITCDGVFNGVSRQYDKRLVVRATKLV